MPHIDAILTLKLGQYRIRRLLATSSYGQLWLATGSAGDVALKLVNEARMAHAEPSLRRHWIASAEAEIAFLRTLRPWDGAHIVRLLDSGNHRGLPVQALELLDDDLGRHLASSGPPPLAQALLWLRQLNQALARVHRQGWRHLDLKPGNVLLTADGQRVKLADFGTSLPLRAGQAHAYCGSASWQAPEQFFPQTGGAYATDARTDYFALGALAFHMLSGGATLRFGALCAAAFQTAPGAGARRLRRSHGAIPPTLHRVDEERLAGALPAAVLPPALRLLRALLAADPLARPANAMQISRLLDACHAAPGSAA